MQQYLWQNAREILGGLCVDIRWIRFAKYAASVTDLKSDWIAQCAIKAGYSVSHAHQMGKQLLERKDIQERIERYKQDYAFEAEISPVSVLREWYAIAFADAGDIVRPEVGCCRYCYGYGNEYQWTPAEYREATEKALRAKKDAPMLRWLRLRSQARTQQKLPRMRGYRQG
jgi:hypothetical protein